MSRPPQKSIRRRTPTVAAAVAAGVLLLAATTAGAQDAAAPPEPETYSSSPAEAPAPPEASPDASPASIAADDIADIFSKVGDQLYEDCIFDLSDEQVEVQTALIQSYIQQGATSAVARKLAANQIQPPKLSEKCEQVRRAEPMAPLPTAPEHAPSDEQVASVDPSAPTEPAEQAEPAEPPSDWSTTTKPSPAKKPPVVAAAKPAKPPEQPPASITLAGRKGLPLWDCAEGVDYVTIKINGYERKLTGGEICSPFQDIVHEVPATAKSFRLGYTIATGRVFVISDEPQASGKTIAWGLSGRDICRNNPDPDCFATRAVGPLPPGEYSFASDRAQRVSWGPKTKRHVAGVYLKKLWNKERFSSTHTAAIMKRGNIAIHVRLKGEMSEACIGLEPKGWAYVASLIKEGRATGLDVYIDEPYPQVAEAPPVIVASGFSLTSLFK